MKDKFVVGVARDASLISYCQPDLIVTINRVVLKDNIPLIALNDFFPNHPFLKLYDTDLMFVLSGDEAECPASLSKDLFKKIKKIRTLVFQEIAKAAKNRQVIINPYFNYFTEGFRKNGFTVIGPPDNLAFEFSKKTVDYQLAKKCHVPLAKNKIVKNLFEVKKILKKISKNSLGFFIASDGDPFYPTNRYVKTAEDLIGLSEDVPYLMVDWLLSKNSPNSQVIIGKKKMFFLGLSDQIIKNNVKYYGNVFPSSLSSEFQKKVKNYSLRLAKVMQKQGYRGIVGFDWIITENNKIFFSEINPRKNRSSAMMIKALNNCRPIGVQPVEEIEFLASQNLDWPDREWAISKKTVWMMELFRVNEDYVVNKNIFPRYSERLIFQKNKTNRVSILNFFSAGTRVGPSGFDIGRIIAVGKSLPQINKLVEKAKTQIDKSLK